MTTRWARLAMPLLLTAPFVTGCMRWAPAWAPETTASDRAGAVDADATDYGVLVAKANRAILDGETGTQSRKAKRELFHRAMRLAERAMYTHPEFKRLADAGAKPWEACKVLDEREMGAMMAWMTALLYDFKEGMTVPERVFNIQWMTHLDPMLARMERIDERWEGGAVPFTRGFYYFVLPRSLGGDRAKAALSFQRAVELGPTRAINRWGRAKFFAVRTKDRQGFVDDLNWVVGRDPASLDDAPDWKAYVQRDAKQLLGEVDRLF